MRTKVYDKTGTVRCHDQIGRGEGRPCVARMVRETAYGGGVAVRDADENPMAHGGLRETWECEACGMRQLRNANGAHEELSGWFQTEEAIAAKRERESWGEPTGEPETWSRYDPVHPGEEHLHPRYRV